MMSLFRARNRTLYAPIANGYIFIILRIAKLIISIHINKFIINILIVLMVIMQIKVIFR